MNKQIINMCGEKYGEWTVLNEYRSVKHRTEWLCECSCGRTKKYIWRQNLINGKSLRCRICANELLKGKERLINDLTGNTYNDLYVIKRCENSKNNSVRYLCRCSCGNLQKIEYSDLIRSKVKRCTQCTNNMKGTHRMSRTKFYNSWRAMKERCENKKHTSYLLYGGRGITLQDSWHTFENFYNDMYESYNLVVKKYPHKRISIDRIDVDGNYTKENCRWATDEMQQNNKTNNVIIDLGYDCNNLFIMLDKYNIKMERYYYLKEKYEEIYTPSEIFKMCLEEVGYAV